MTFGAVAWVALGIIGVLLAMSRIGLKQQLDWPIAIGITMAGVGLFALVTTFPQFSTGFSILGTLVLAGAALMAIRQSAKQFRDDRLERKLGVLIAWAEDILRCETATQLSPLPWEECMRMGLAGGEKGLVASIEHYERNRRTNLVLRYLSLAAMGTRIPLIARQLDRQWGSNLLCLAQQTSDRLEEHIQSGITFIEEQMTVDEYKEQWQSLRASAVALLERAEQALDS